MALGFLFFDAVDVGTVGLSVIVRGEKAFEGNLWWDLRGQRIQQSYPAKYDGTLDTCGEVRGALAYMGTLISWDLTLPRPRSR